MVNHATLVDILKFIGIGTGGYVFKIVRINRSDLVCSEKLSEILLPAESNSGRKEDTSVCESISSSNLEETEQHHQSTINEVNSILKGTPSGRALLAQFGTTGLLDQRSRKRLCHLIVDIAFILWPTKSQQFLKGSTCQMATYFVPYMSFGPGLRRLAKGKLLDCVNNRRKSLRVSGKSPPGLEGYENDSVIEHEVVQESVRWLHNSTDPWQMVEVNWDRTTCYRLFAKDGTTISKYFQDYPALKRPTGYLLVLSETQEENFVDPSSPDDDTENNAESDHRTSSTSGISTPSLTKRTKVNIKMSKADEVLTLIVACKLRKLPNNTKIFAEKLINDVLYYATLGRLNEYSTIVTNGHLYSSARHHGNDVPTSDAATYFSTYNYQ
ncbi:hypothetical protein FQR65_LT18395 [Abscondita terminalis]|nr:hypothetical protein FQR65_LT18395 [Abscondita terminalis]